MTRDDFVPTFRELIERLERRELITTDPVDEFECCGLLRDDDGFCVYRPYHPVYVERGK